MVKKLLSRLSALLLVLVGESGLAVSAAEQEGTIVFGKNDVKINAANVTGNDNLGNSWTIVTEGTTSYTGQDTYYQVGSSNNPASSITFSTTLPDDLTITSFETKLGGFSGTAGSVKLFIDNVSVAEGNLNGATNITIGGNIANTKGKNLKVTVTGISKGVKVYYVSYKFDSNAKEGATIVANDVNLEVTQELNNFYSTNSTGAVTFSSDKPSVAVIEDKVLKAVGLGVANITISQEEDATYAATTKSFKVTVTTKDAVDPIGGNAGTGYVLVTNIADIADGDEVVIAGINASGAYYVMGADRGNNRGAVAVNVTDGFINTLPEDAAVITLEANGTSWNLNVGSGYLYAASSGSNYLKTEEEVDQFGNANASISISDNHATIQFNGTYTRNLMRFNHSNNPPLFSCYATATTGSAPIIFKKVESTTIPITIGEAQYRTAVSAKAYNVPENLTAYIVSGRTADGVTFTEVRSVAAGEPVILHGAARDYELELATGTVTATEGNLLQVSTATTGNGVYVLANKTKGVGFYKWAGGALGAGRVYLPASSNAREYLSFNNSEMTGIENVESEVATLRFFDMQGRSVAHPTKGLYIVNGKKIIIK